MITADRGSRIADRGQDLLSRKEFHSFDAAGARYLYLVPSAAVVRLDAATQAVLDALGDEHLPREQVTAALADRFTAEDVDAGVRELLAMRAIGVKAAPAPTPTPPPRIPRRIPLTTMVLNVT